MELARLDCRLDQRDHVAGVVASAGAPVALACVDADPVVVRAALDPADGALGVWLAVHDGYPAALAARDVATLAWLVDLGPVVIAGERASSQAEVVRALLSDDPVDFANEVATLRGAYNRPAPPRPLAVWSFDGEGLTGPAGRLVARESRSTPAGELTTFA